MEHKKTALIEPIMLLIFSFGVLYEGIRLTRSAKGVQDVMGPGTYIIVLGALLIIINLAHIVSNFSSVFFLGRKQHIDTGEDHVKGVNLTIVAMVAIVALYIVLIQLLGYLVATSIFFLLIFRVVGVSSWNRNVALTIILSVAYYIIFVRYCSVIFPRGLIFG